jgi:ribosome-binding protein aMBF1 (putative translation factor)
MSYKYGKWSGRNARRQKPRRDGVSAKGRRKPVPARNKIAAVAEPDRPRTRLKSSGGRLVMKFFDSLGRISVARVAKDFGMSKVQLAETIGLKPETVYRSARLAAPKTQSRATEMLEIVGRIADWAGGEKQAMAWYRAEPIAAFGGRTAESLVKEGKAAAVHDYLDHVATGGFA